MKTKRKKPSFNRNARESLAFDGTGTEAAGRIVVQRRLGSLSNDIRQLACRLPMQLGQPLVLELERELVEPIR